MRAFNYSAIREQKWDSEILGLIAAIYKEAGKQELYLKQRPEEWEKLVEIAKVQSTEASNAIEGIVTTNTLVRQLVAEKTTPRNRVHLPPQACYLLGSQREDRPIHSLLQP